MVIHGDLADVSSLTHIRADIMLSLVRLLDTSFVCQPCFVVPLRLCCTAPLCFINIIIIILITIYIIIFFFHVYASDTIS